jgi:hypothetical protein
MGDSVMESLILDLLEWLVKRDRSYEEVMDAWRTSCPRLPVWEEVFVTNERLPDTVSGDLFGVGGSRRPELPRSGFRNRHGRCPCPEVAGLFPRRPSLGRNLTATFFGNGLRGHAQWQVLETR